MNKHFPVKSNFLLEIFLYLLSFGLSYIFAFIIRLEGDVPPELWVIIKKSFTFVILFRTAAFLLFRVFHGQWRYCSILDVIAIFKAISLSSILIVGFFYFLFTFQGVPRSVFIIDWMLLTLVVSGIRFSRRLLKEILINTSPHVKKVLIVGAGELGKNLINEMKSNWESGYNPVALVDDDPKNLNQVYYGVKVLGTRMSIPHIASTKKIDEIIITIPCTSGKIIRETTSLCRLSHTPFKILSTNNGRIDQRTLIDRIRKIDIQDLIGRKQIHINYDEMGQFFKDKRIVVTGAAGSIGSELCRQIANFHLSKLITLDRSENGLFYLDRELSDAYPDLDYSLALADITDYNETQSFFSRFKPHIVFHAAAYKHVPMMEQHPYQAIKTNILGTKNVLDIALANNVEKFIMISTDKAVNPTSYMGLTKRIAEDFVKMANQQGETKCISVRFGNVIGSSGSVLRIFQEQISKGGPVTVTHPDVARYFMSIPEAVILVLQAASMGQGGDVFILKMGELVKIYDLAKELILLAGLVPNQDIKIDFTGLRPGEKIIEQLWEDSEKCTEEVNENLFVIKNGCDVKTILNDNYIHELLALAVKDTSASNGYKAKLRSLIYEVEPAH
ncbi:polysaccharide biosynthesis protein [candidate division KSB1 bacterium]|nr:polysaccharide biosynthesis protein [candidate division KSB1 bacterium]RQW01080.1 MAG: polysaccharide biosynthesis protein [candidate division KSB1 bacterium]